MNETKGFRLVESEVILHLLEMKGDQEWRQLLKMLA